MPSRLKNKNVCPLLFILLLVGCFHECAYAQGGRSGFQIQVIDSAHKVPLTGANVWIISGRDTSRQVTNERGAVVYQAVFRSDSVAVRVHHIGYGPKELFLRVPPAGRLIGKTVNWSTWVSRFSASPSMGSNSSTNMSVWLWKTSGRMM